MSIRSNFDKVPKLREGANLNLRISKELRKALLQWSVDTDAPYGYLVRSLLTDYLIKGKRFADER